MLPGPTDRITLLASGVEAPVDEWLVSCRASRRNGVAVPCSPSIPGVQAAAVLAAVGLGFFTSMNQALIGAMTGTAAARGRHTVHAATLLGILRGWLIGPGAGSALAYAITRVVTATAGTHTALLAH